MPVNRALVNRAVPVDVYDVARDVQFIDEPLHGRQGGLFSAHIVSTATRYTRPQQRVAPPLVSLPGVDAS